MSVEGAGPRQGADEGTDSPRPAGDVEHVVPERRDVRGISDLTFRIITPYLSNPVLHRCLRVVLLVLGVVCLVATGVRLSPLPLLPLPLFAVAYYALRRARAAGNNDRALLVWFATLFAAFVLGFWVLSLAGRWVS